MGLAANPDSNRLPATAKHYGELVKPTTNQPPDRGIGTFRAARRQLGRALAAPLEALGERLRGTAASEASKAAARSKYRLQQVLNTDRSFPVAEPSPPPIPAGVFADVPAGVFGDSTRAQPIATAQGEVTLAAPEARPTPVISSSSATPSSLPPPKPAGPAVPPLRPAAPAIVVPKPAVPASIAPASVPPAPATPTLAAPQPPVAPPPAPTPAPSLPPPPVAAAVPRAPEAPSDVVSAADEPIRTRSMARLLASQGHPARALAIYDWLLAANASDDSLRAEAEALRSTARA
jgi:hypothetical protein